MGWLIAGFLGLVGTMITAGMTAHNTASQERIAEEQNTLAQQSLNQQTQIANQNFGLSQEQFNYQKELNALQMQREDNAMQRRVADLKAAGLSPLMAGNGASTGSYLSANAPQYDGSGIMQAMSNMLGIKTDQASRKQMAYQFERQLHLQTAQQVADLVSMRLDNQYKRSQISMLNEQIDYIKEHGLRDPSLQNWVIDRYGDKIGSIIDSITDSYFGENGGKPLVIPSLSIGSDSPVIRNIIKSAQQTPSEVVEKTLGGMKKAYVEPAQKVLSTAVENTKSSGKKAKNAVVRAWNGLVNWTSDKYQKGKNWINKKFKK